MCVALKRPAVSSSREYVIKYDIASKEIPTSATIYGEFPSTRIRSYKKHQTLTIPSDYISLNTNTFSVALDKSNIDNFSY